MLLIVCILAFSCVYSCVSYVTYGRCIWPGRQVYLGMEQQGIIQDHTEEERQEGLYSTGHDGKDRLSCMHIHNETRDQDIDM